MDRGYKKLDTEPDIWTLIFVSYNWKRIFENAIPSGMNRIPDIGYQYPFQKKPESEKQTDILVKTDMTKSIRIFRIQMDYPDSSGQL